MKFNDAEMVLIADALILFIVFLIALVAVDFIPLLIRILQ